MNALDDQLQHGLARLEAGEPLEACVKDLPEPEADLVRQASALRSTPAPVPDAVKFARQRREYMRAAGALQSPQPAQAKTSFPWALPGLALAGLGLAAMCALVPLLLAALVWLRGARDLPVAQVSPELSGARADLTEPAGSQPAIVEALPPDAQTAVLQDVRGLVEWQDSEGTWQPVTAGQVLRAGQRLRTGALSGLTLVFHDGSHVQMGASAELSIDELNAGGSGPRVVALTQWVGESTHTVAPNSAPGSRYAVNTPNGAGLAKGTVFHVQVTPSLLVRFDVDEGVVDVTHQAVTVVVVAGQSTIVTADQPPSDPAFLISGEGELQAVGDKWHIAGREFVTHPNTVVFGEPQVGDWVSFEGRVIAEGLRVLDKVVLLHRAAGNRFSLVGQVSFIDEDEWIIAGRPIRVDGDSQIDPDIAVGDWVEVTGGISGAGEWWASRIERLGDNGPLDFRFAGTVQSRSDTLWVVGGLTVTVDANTFIDDNLGVGDVVLVEGRLLDDGTWLAESIRRITPAEGVFEIIGVLDSLDPLTVNGIRLLTGDWTDVDAGLAVGDRVRASGRLLDDGTWLALEVERLDDDAESVFEFVGVVESVDPWVVAGIPLSVTADTEIDSGIAAGDLVRVEGEILPSGTWLAHEIDLLDDELGCLDLHAVVIRVEGDQIVLADGQVIDLGDVLVEGDIAPGSVIVIYGCVGEDGEMRVAVIIVIYQLPEVPATPTPTPQATVPPSEGAAGQVTICHRPPGNPDNAHTLTVGAPAVPAHLAHGDSLGACP